MARIPFIEQQAGGPGVADLVAPRPNQALGQLAQQASRAEQMLDAIADQDASLDAVRKTADFDLQWAAEFERLKGAVPGGQGFTDQAMQSFGERMNALLQAEANPRAAAYLEGRLLQRQSALVGEASRFEAEAIAAGRREKVQTLLNRFSNALLDQPGRYDGYVDDVEAYLASSGIPQSDLPGMRKSYRALFAQSAVRGYGAKSPAMALKVLGDGLFDDDIDATGKAALIDEMQREQATREREARERAAAANAGAASSAAVEINRFRNGQGEFSQADLEPLRGRLGVDAFNRLQIAFDDARAYRDGQNAERVNVAAKIEAGGNVDPSNAREVTAYDEYFQGSVLPSLQAQVASLPPAEQKAALTTRMLTFIRDQGVAPKSLLGSLRGALRAGAPGERLEAVTTIEQLKAIAPRALLDIDDETLRSANTIAAYVDGGMAPADAVRAADDVLRRPANVDKALSEAYDRLTQNDTTTDWLASAMDESWWGSPTVPAPVAIEVSALVRSEFQRNGGNLEAARRTALDLTKKRYGETTVNGSREVTRNPIEQHYQLPWLSKEEIAKAAKAEAITDITAGGAVDGVLTDDRVRIRPYPVKGVTAPDGRPSYAIEVQDSSGAWTVQMDEDEKSPTFGLPKPWWPSLAKAKAEREAVVKQAIEAAKAGRSSVTAPILPAGGFH